jgi:hypothetical protein
VNGPDSPLLPAQAASPRATLVLALAIFTAALIGRGVFFTQSVNSDTAMFVYMGKLVFDGKQIGIDLIDNKLPSVGLLMSLPYLLIGSAWWGYTLLGMVLMTLAPLLLARSAGRTFGPQAIIPVALAAAIWLNFPPMVYGLLQLETLQTFFCVIAACQFLALLGSENMRNAVVAGVCVGIAMYAKPTAGAMTIAMGFAVLIGTDWTWKKRLQAILSFGFGVLIPILLCIGLLVITGMLAPIPATIRQLSEYAANSTADWIDVVKPIFVLGVLMFPVIVWGYVFRRDAVTSPAHRAATVFVIAWLIMETIGVISQRRMYAYHFLPMGAPAALMLGLFARRLRFASVAFAFAPLAIITLIFAGQIVSFPDRQAKMTAIIAHLNQAAEPGDLVWMDDYPRLMVETQLSPGSRVPLTFLFGNSDDAPLRFGQLILDDLKNRKPEWVVVHRDIDAYVHFYQTYMAEMSAYPNRRENFAIAWRAIDDYVRENYLIERQIDNLDIRRRSDLILNACD